MAHEEVILSASAGGHCCRIIKLPGGKLVFACGRTAARFREAVLSEAAAECVPAAAGGAVACDFLAEAVTAWRDWAGALPGRAASDLIGAIDRHPALGRLPDMRRANTA